MKEILSYQFDAICGGWADKDGSGHHSAENGGSRSGGNGGRGNGGPSLMDRTVSAYHNSPYGSGAGANGFFGGTNGIGSKGSNFNGRDHVGTDR
ncbi:hypothetical protein [Kosakonia cowanii]|uniref:hypothetical protein n=1 Tax=Kosakonia cowanii TaxID=208223 RepID=UPI004062A35B